MTRPPQWFLDAAREQGTPDPIAVDMAGPPADDDFLGLGIERPRSAAIFVWVLIAALSLFALGLLVAYVLTTGPR